MLGVGSTTKSSRSACRCKLVLPSLYTVLMHSFSYCFRNHYAFNVCQSAQANTMRGLTL